MSCDFWYGYSKRSMRSVTKFVFRSGHRSWWPSFALGFATFFCLASAHANESNSWSEGIASIEQQNYVQAAERFETWIAEHAGRGEYSAPAHFNAGLAYAGAKRPGKAISHYVRAMHWSSNPIANLEITQRIASLEQNSGIHDGLSQSLSFVLQSLIDPALAAWLAAIGAWLLLLDLAWRGFGRARARDILIRGLALSLVFVSLMGVLIQKTSPPLAVIDSEQEVRVLSSPTANPAEESAPVLPSGSIVAISSLDATYAKLQTPASGYVERSKLILF